MSEKSDPTTAKHQNNLRRWQPNRRQVLWAIGMLVALVITAFLIVKIVNLYPDIQKGLLEERVLTFMGLIVTVTVIIVLLAIGGTSLGWTGFANRTIWDWLELLGALAVPIMVAFVGIYFSAQQSRTQGEVEANRAQASAFQAYLGQMNHLLLEEDLRNSKEGDEVRILARARTLTVLEGLDPDRKGRLLQFLNEADLIDVENPVLNLSGVDAAEADLSGAYLGNTDLSGANLSGANLSGAKLLGTDLSCAPPVDPRLTSSLNCTDLSGANLSNADLMGASLGCAEAAIWWNEGEMDRTNCVDLSGANLSGTNLVYANLDGANLEDAQGITSEEVAAQAESLEGATMPDGQRILLGLPEKSSNSIDIRAGEYATDEFEPAFRFKVPEGNEGQTGWAVSRQEALGVLPLEGTDGFAELYFTSPRFVFPSNPSEQWVGGYGYAPKNADDWASWFQKHPNLETSDPVPVKVGNASGKQIDVTGTSAPEHYPKECGPTPCVPLFPTNDVAVHLSINDYMRDSRRGISTSPYSKSDMVSYEGSKERFIIVDVESESVVIKIEPTFADEFDNFQRKADEVLETVEWGIPPAPVSREDGEDNGPS